MRSSGTWTGPCLQAVRKGERLLEDLPENVVGNQKSQIADLWELQMKLAAHTHMAAEDLLRGIPLACRHMVFSQVSLCKFSKAHCEAST